jgi:DNA adenine methylase
VSFEEWAALKALQPLEPATAFVGFGCSFGGIFFGSYARPPAARPDRNWARGTKVSLAKKLARFANCEFIAADYRQLYPAGCAIYCDPPYRGAYGYKATGYRFDSDEFFAVARRWAEHNVVMVSERAAPDDFQMVWEHTLKGDLQDASQEAKGLRVERLFIKGG